MGWAHSFGILPVMKREVKQQVTDLIQEPIRQAGFVLAEVVLSQYKSNVSLRVFVYGDQGVTIDDCARLSRLIGELIETTDLFENGDTLEVSSPGLDRPLKTPLDYRYRVGETVKVEFIDRSRKGVRGVIRSAGDTSVELDNGEGSVRIELAEVKRAQIVF